MDNDVLLYRDVYPLVSRSYQFVTRWTNLHVLKLTQRSALAQRILEQAKAMPINHPAFQEDIVDGICQEVGYMQVRVMRKWQKSVFC